MGRKSISFEVVNAIIEVMEKHNQYAITLVSLQNIRDRLGKEEPKLIETIICSAKQDLSNEDKTAGNKRNE